MSDDLTPTEDLLMGVLAARVRTGEQVWTFTDTHLPTLRSLRAKGLLEFSSAPTERAQKAWLTDAGRAEYLAEGYTEPVTRLREHLAEQQRALDLTNQARRDTAAKAAELEARVRRLHRQLEVAVAHLGGVASAAALDDLLWFRDVLVLHEDGSTTTGRLGTDTGGGYVIDRPGGPVPIHPVGDTTGTRDGAGVDVVRPVAPGPACA